MSNSEILAIAKPCRDGVWELRIDHGLRILERMAVGLGMVGTRDFTPAALYSAYGRSPAGYMPFVRLKIR